MKKSEIFSLGRVIYFALKIYSKILFENEADMIKGAVHDGFGLKAFESDVADIISEFAGTVNVFLFHLSKLIR